MVQSRLIEDLEFGGQSQGILLFLRRNFHLPVRGSHSKSINHQKDFSGLIAPPVARIPPAQKVAADCTDAQMDSPEW